MVRRAAPLLLVTALGACTTVGPNYRVPDEAVVKAPEAQGRFSPPRRAPRRWLCPIAGGRFMMTPGWMR
jgi:predicted small lipoprotein YifL